VQALFADRFPSAAASKADSITMENGDSALPKAIDATDVRRVLIFRLGSLGDTAVAIPVFHQIAKVFPNAERRLLTNMPIALKAISAYSLLENSGLVHGYIDYPTRTRSLGVLWALRQTIRAFRPDVLVYLAQSATRNVSQDERFFKMCGIPKCIGLPATKDMCRSRLDEASGLYEQEPLRIARCVSELGPVNFLDREMWSLNLSESEHGIAEDSLLPIGGKRFVAASIGTKRQTNEWGAERWAELMPHVAHRLPDHALVMVGSADEFESSGYAASRWPGETLNLCGQIAPRPNAGVLGRASLFLGQDSGNMHLAALSGTPCVAVFSARNLPGQWFPFGERHRVLYHKTTCFGCGLDVCVTEAKKCIVSITVDEVLGAVDQVLRCLKQPPEQLLKC
jgi:heptosyltransferase III